MVEKIRRVFIVTVFTFATRTLMTRVGVLVSNFWGRTDSSVELPVSWAESFNEIVT